MKTENKVSRYRPQFPKLSFRERMMILGYAHYLGYDFDYDFNKKKAILVTTNDGIRRVLFIVKISGKIIGIDKDGNKESISSMMHITKILHEKGIFKLPDNADIGVNEYIRENLQLIAQF